MLTRWKGWGGGGINQISSNIRIYYSKNNVAEDLTQDATFPKFWSSVESQRPPHTAREPHLVTKLPWLKRHSGKSGSVQFSRPMTSKEEMPCRLASLPPITNNPKGSSGSRSPRPTQRSHILWSFRHLVTYNWVSNERQVKGWKATIGKNCVPDPRHGKRGNTHQVYPLKV